MNVVEVNIGEVRIVQGNITIKTLLGSCVGIAFLWKEKNICGMAHCLLPTSPVGENTLGGKFVDQAIHTLLTLMQITPENYKEIQIFIAGGGRVMQNLPFDIGRHNVESARKHLNNYGLKFKELGIGGDTGQYFTVNFQERFVSVSKLNSLNETFKLTAG